mmetsp:Transcript_125065/g.286572  ORF Transcript_125065/g.286572 Transcript_125065/m.286572 type:complete len:154 (-) Transcript_125065:26-487(-)
MCQWMFGVEPRSVLHVVLLSSISGVMRLPSSFRMQLLNFACVGCGHEYKGPKIPSRSFTTRSRKGIWLRMLTHLADLGDSEKLVLRDNPFRRRHPQALRDIDMDSHQIGWLNVSFFFLPLPFCSSHFPVPYSFSSGRQYQLHRLDVLFAALGS